MPATAGRIRMPANNRLSVSDSLKSSEIWQKSVGYDPYAPKAAADGDSGLVQRSRLFDDNDRSRLGIRHGTGNPSSSIFAKLPGACGKCGEVGHLTYQCRNTETIKEPNSLNTVDTSKDYVSSLPSVRKYNTEGVKGTRKRTSKRSYKECERELSGSRIYVSDERDIKEARDRKKVCRSRRRRRFDTGA